MWLVSQRSLHVYCIHFCVVASMADVIVRIFVHPGKPYSSRGGDDSDRQELLRQAEPVDYTADTVDPFEDYPTGGSINNDDILGRYQSQPLRGSSVGRYGGRTGAPPPKGIFDDVWCQHCVPHHSVWCLAAGLPVVLNKVHVNQDINLGHGISLDIM